MQATESSEVRKSHVDGVPNVGRLWLVITPGAGATASPRS